MSHIKADHDHRLTVFTTIKSLYGLCHLVTGPCHKVFKERRVMEIIYEGVLNGETVTVDEVNVKIGDSRYPVRNISAVHPVRAEKPSTVLAQLLAIILVLGYLASSLSCIYEFFEALFAYGYVRSSSFEWLLILTAFLLLGSAIVFLLLPSPSANVLRFGTSGNNDDVVAISVMSKADLFSYVFSKRGLTFQPLDWQAISQPSYDEIRLVADAIGESIDRLQKQS